MYKRKSSDKQIDEVIYKAEHDGFGLNEEELDAYMANYPFGNGANPIGTIIAFMGNTPPMGYLACDGSEYDIADYPKLAKFFKDQFGSTQYFGGTDDKFKVPDLKGEFLRGTGTNGHTNSGNGASVGTHQNATAIPWYIKWTDNKLYFPGINSTVARVDADSDYTPSNITKQGRSIVNSNSNDTFLDDNTHYTARPTNTSVLYCIKAEATSIEDLDDNSAFITWQEYSTEEKCIGRWIDGKPLYQKTIQTKMPTVSTDGTFQYTYIDISNLNYSIINITNVFAMNDTKIWSYPFAYITNFGYQGKCFINNTKQLQINNSYTGFNNLDVFVTLQYTKTTDPENSFTLNDLDNFKLLTSVSNNYSLEEKVIGTWIDGRPLYQKTIQDTMPVVTADGTHVNKNVTTGISNIKYIYKIDCTMIATVTGGYIQAMSLPYITNLGYQAKIFVQDNIPILNSDVKVYSNAPVYITLQYTKTTD